MSATATMQQIDRAPATATARSRIGALAGLAFAVCLFLGVAMLEIPDGATDQQLVAWWSDSANQMTAIASMYLFVLAGLCFLVFLVKLRSRLLEAEGGRGELTALAVAAGTVFVAMLFVAAASRGMIGFAVTSPATGEPLPDPSTLRYVPQLGYAITGTGGLLAAAVTMATTSAVIVRTAVFGRWLAWAGVAAAVAVIAASALLVGAFAIPALLLWTIAMSAALWRRT
jgi:hypothetical protein